MSISVSEEVDFGILNDSRKLEPRTKAGTKEHDVNDMVDSEPG